VDADDRLLTVREVADAMRVSNMTVYRLIRAGDLKAIRVGRNFRIRESDVDRFLDDRAVPVADSVLPA
jgi:excisionase family DNA binding protein